MIHLAGAGTEARLSLNQLAREAEAPPAFLSKVLQQLVRTGFVLSHRGKRGGFSLAPRPQPPTLLDIVDALEGLPPLNDCLKSEGQCARHTWCGAHVVWLEAQARMREVLAGATLDMMVATTARRRAMAGRP